VSPDVRRLDMLDPMACLKDGVPLSLVIDLLDAKGPNAEGIYSDEPADTSWTEAVPGEIVPTG
jgi:hypothetical protein